MNDWTHLPKGAFKTLKFAAAATFVLGFLAHGQFGVAQKAWVGTDPASLLTVVVQGDQKTASCPFSYGNGNYRNQRNTPSCLYADDYPGVAFELSGASRTVTFTPQQRVELLVNRDPAELVGKQQGERFSVVSAVKVDGVRRDGKLLADPQPIYQRAVAYKQRQQLYAWALLLTTLGAAAFAVREIRKILRDPRL